MMHMLYFVLAGLLISDSVATPFFGAPFLGRWHSSESWGGPSPSRSLPFSTFPTNSLTPTGTASTNPPISTNASVTIDPFFPTPTGLVNFTDPATPGVITFLTAIPVTNIVEVSTDIPLSTTLSVSGSEVTALPVTFSSTFTAVVPFLTVVTVEGSTITSGASQPVPTTFANSSFTTVGSQSTGSSFSVPTSTASL